MIRDFVFTSDSVTEGHPDKLCDQISDAIIDEYLRQDPHSHIIAECAVSTGIVFIAARFRSGASVDVPSVARSVIDRIGYERDEFNARNCSIMTNLNEFPRDNYPVVDEADMDDAAIDRVGADSHVNVFGFACRQNASMMPLPISLAHKLSSQLAAAYRNGAVRYLAPDGKTQVGVEYHDRRPSRIHSVTLVAALQPETRPSPRQLAEELTEAVIRPAFADEGIRPDADTHSFFNPGGPFLVGGPSRHSGLTGRKNAIDTYGEYARQSGAALSGKDPSRIDRVGAYAARYAAKNVVAAGLADECEIQLSYAIGRAKPVTVQIETYGTGSIAEEEIMHRLVRHIDFRPAAIVREFGLRHLPEQNPDGFFRRLAVYGHVGRTDLTLPWERTDRAEALADGG